MWPGSCREPAAHRVSRTGRGRFAAASSVSHPPRPGNTAFGLTDPGAFNASGATA